MTRHSGISASLTIVARFSANSVFAECGVLRLQKRRRHGREEDLRAHPYSGGKVSLGCLSKRTSSTGVSARVEDRVHFVSTAGLIICTSGMLPLDAILRKDSDDPSIKARAVRPPFAPAKPAQMHQLTEVLQP